MSNRGKGEHSFPVCLSLRLLGAGANLLLHQSVGWKKNNLAFLLATLFSYPRCWKTCSMVSTLSPCFLRSLDCGSIQPCL